MAHRGKKYKKVKEKQPTEVLEVNAGLDAVKKLSYSEFDGTIELALTMKVNKDTDTKSLKGSVSLPHSTSTKKVRIAVFTSDEAIAKKAGADLFDLEQLTKDIKDGKIEFDVAIASPDVMAKIAALGKELGPRGLMPNPKTGTVTDDIAAAVNEYKTGKINFKASDSGVMNFAVGKVSTDNDKIIENINVAVEAASQVMGKRAQQAIATAHLAPTMGPSVKIDLELED